MLHGADDSMMSLQFGQVARAEDDSLVSGDAMSGAARKAIAAKEDIRIHSIRHRPGTARVDTEVDRKPAETFRDGNDTSGAAESPGHEEAFRPLTVISK